MPFTKPILYSYFRSSATWRVRFALALKKVEYEYRAVNILKKEQFDSSYKDLNPKSEVPVLIIDGHYLTQSIPIIEYLEETRKNDISLLPSDPLKRFQARSLSEIINAGIQPLQNLSVLKIVGAEKRDEWLKNFLNKGLYAFENTLKQTSGKYCVGDNISIADLCLVPQYEAAVRFNVDVSQFNLINKINSELSKLPEYQTSHPFSQPDCPEELKFIK